MKLLTGEHGILEEHERVCAEFWPSECSKYSCGEHDLLEMLTPVIANCIHDPLDMCSGYQQLCSGVLQRRSVMPQNKFARCGI